MATVEIIVRVHDDLGNIINDIEKRTYQLELPDSSFDSIEKATTEFKNQALPDIQADLLGKCQSDFIQKKDDNLRCNGTTPVTIKTLHGRFRFKLQRFTDVHYNRTTYFDLTHQFMDGYVSNRLKEFSAFYSNRLSYEEIEDLLERTAGRKQLSDQTVRSIVVDKAIEVSNRSKSRALEILGNDSLNFPVVNLR